MERCLFASFFPSSISLLFSFSFLELIYSVYEDSIHLLCVFLLCLSFFNIFDCCLIPPAGYYTCVEVIFTLRRQVGFYMMGVYAPTLLIVVLSWLSFWINPDASAARVPLGMDYLISSTT